MFIQPKPTGVSFTALMSSTRLAPKGQSPFPYTPDVVRCRYCTHCRGGRCSLKSCCCLPERVKARSCTFTEILNDCFADVRNLSFRYRLRLAAERQRQVNSCFLGAGHRSRFYDAAKRFPNSSPAFLAQLYVLTAENWIWSIMSDHVYKDFIDYDVDLPETIGFDRYMYYTIAYDIGNSSAVTDSIDLTDEEVVSFDVFRAACSAAVISRYGMDAVKIAERFRDRRSKRKTGKDSHRDR